FILQETYGLSPQGYSYAFGVNSLGVIVFSQLGGRAARRWGERPVIGFGITVLAVSGLGLLAAGLLELSVAAVLIFLFALVAAVSATAPPLTALALGAHPEMAGTASSLLGMARYGFGGVAAPLVGLGGAGAVIPLGVLTVTVAALAALAAAAGHSRAQPSPCRQSLPPRPGMGLSTRSSIPVPPISTWDQSVLDPHSSGTPRWRRMVSSQLIGIDEFIVACWR